MKWIQMAVLLDKRRLQHLFPDARIVAERFFGLTKSLYAIPLDNRCNRWPLSPHRRQIQRDRDIEIIHAATRAGAGYFSTGESERGRTANLTAAVYGLRRLGAARRFACHTANSQDA
jgi:hypothetical protein